MTEHLKSPPAPSRLLNRLLWESVLPYGLALLVAGFAVLAVIAGHYLQAGAFAPLALVYATMPRQRHDWRRVGYYSAVGDYYRHEVNSLENRSTFAGGSWVRNWDEI